jgi:hypothetical protein
METMKRALEVLAQVADRVRSSLQRKQLEIAVGSWLHSSALKVQKRSWAESPLEPGSDSIGVFFSVWVNEEGLRKNRACYNIHALRMRSLRAYSVQSREFAAAFRARFKSQKNAWPEVSVAYGPQTLMQGWIAWDDGRSAEDIAQLIHRFVPLSDTIDELLAQRKKLSSGELATPE